MDAARRDLPRLIDDAIELAGNFGLRIDREWISVDKHTQKRGYVITERARHSAFGSPDPERHRGVTLEEALGNYLAAPRRR